MDKVKLYPQERLDLGDIQALQELVYQYTQRSLGNLLGGMRGLLSRPVYTFNNGSPDTLSLSDFSFVCTKAEGTDAGSVGVKTLQTSEIVHFNSALSDHGNYPINLTSVTSSMFLWARPLMVDTDTENRRKWDLNTGSEITFSDNVRSSMRVEFAFSATDPTQAGDAYQYSNIAKVTAITGTTITMDFISAFDNPSLQAVNSESGTFYSSLNTESTAFSGALFTYSPSNSSNAYDQGFGLLQVLHLLGKALRLHKYEGTNDPSGTTKTTPWFSTPQLSLNGAYKYLTNHDTSLSQITNNIADIISTLNTERTAYPQVLFSCVVKGNPYKGSLPIWELVANTGFNVDGIYDDPNTIFSPFYIDISDALISEAPYLQTMSITQIANPSTHTQGGNIVYNYNRLMGQPYIYPAVTLSNTLYNNAHGAVGDNDYIPPGRQVKIQMLPWLMNHENAFLPTENVTYIDATQDMYFAITGFGKRT